MVKNRQIKRDGPVFATAGAFRHKLTSYFAECGHERLPNVAGFCSRSRITRSEYFALREYYPTEFDIAESTFIDIAVNSKLLNTGTGLGYLLGTLNGIALEPDEAEDGTLRVVSEHDLTRDGA